jgi:stalled ribosome rescue protein Dom34
MDSEHARIFSFGAAGVEKHHFERHEPDHHSHSTHDVPKDSAHLFQHVATQLAAMERVLLLGPGQARDHFKKHLEAHHDKSLLGRIVGSETADHLTDPQIEAAGRKWFKEHDPLLK